MVFFIVVGGLEQTGVLEKIAEFIESICGGNLAVMLAIILWVSAMASAVVDNIPFAATMVPVIKSLAATVGADYLPTLAYTLSIGTDIGGSATPIGASANVVGTSVVSKSRSSRQLEGILQNSNTGNNYCAFDFNGICFHRIFIIKEGYRYE